MTFWTRVGKKHLNKEQYLFHCYLVYYYIHLVWCCVFVDIFSVWSPRPSPRRAVPGGVCGGSEERPLYSQTASGWPKQFRPIETLDFTSSLACTSFSINIIFSVDPSDLQIWLLLLFFPPFFIWRADHIQAHTDTYTYTGTRIHIHKFTHINTQRKNKRPSL